MTADNADETPCTTTPDESRLPRQETPPQPPYLLAVQAAMLAYLATSLLLGLLRHVASPSSPVLLVFFASLPLSVAATAAFLASLSGHARHHGWSDTLQWLPPQPQPRPRLPFPLRLFLLLGATLVTAAATHYLVRLLGGEPGQQNIVSLFARTQSRPMLIMLTLLAVLIAPLSEELLFRLGLHQTIRRCLKPAPASLVTAAIFALAHGQLITIPPLFVVGLFLQQAKDTGGLWLSIRLHAAYNATQILMIIAGVASD